MPGGGAGVVPSLAVTRTLASATYCPFQSAPAFQTMRLLRPGGTPEPTLPLSAVAGMV